MWHTSSMWMTYQEGVVFLAFQTLCSGAVCFDMRLFCLLLNNLGVSRHTLGGAGTFSGGVKWLPSGSHQVVKVGQQRNLLEVLFWNHLHVHVLEGGEQIAHEFGC